ncbi:MAG: fibronectin type III domain-containing protein, partial [Proteiniphilum sp.]|nr:fibronectin type III domain-containing protein [Proteiniphilum sp.]
NETLWNIEYGPTGFTPGNGTVITSVSNPFNLTGLTPGSNYSYYVQADCGGGDLSNWSPAGEILSGHCLPSTTYQDFYIDNFFTTNGVTNITNNSSGTGSDGYQNSTGMVVSQFENGTVSFSATASYGTYGFAIWVDWNDNLTFEASERIFTSSGYVDPAVGTFTVPVGAPLGNHRMRVMADYDESDPTDPCLDMIEGEVEDYTFQVIPVPSCLPVSTLSAILVSTTEANLSWTVNGAETSWNIEYGPAGFTTGNGTVISGVTNPYSLTGLTPDTEYDYYVQADCGGGNLSTWSGPGSFYTGYCIPTVTNDGDYLSNIQFSSATQNAVYSTATPPAGNYANESATIIQHYENSPFNVSTTYVGGSNGVNIWVDWNNDLSFDASEEVFSMAGSAATKTGTITIPTGTAVGDYRMRVRGEWGSTSDPLACGEEDWGSTVDFTLEVIAIPTCFPVSGLSASILTYTDAEFSWTENGTASSWIIEYGAPGFTPGNGTIVTATSNPFTITGLNPNTEYDYYVTADCGSGDLSIAQGPESFFTGACVPAPESGDGDGITNVTMGTINNTTGEEPGYYGNYTAQSTTVNVGSNLNINITLETGYEYNMWAWVDWNMDLDFNDASEAYYLGLSLDDDPTIFSANITIPANAVPGNYVIRLGGSDATFGTLGTTAPSDPCYTDEYASFEDYTLNVICDAPAITAQPVAVTECENGTANFSVTATGDALEYQWQMDGSDLTGEDASTLSLTNISATDAGDYSVIITGACGTETSTAVSLTVTPSATGTD